MKITFTLLLAGLFSLQGFSQTSFGVKAGITSNLYSFYDQVDKTRSSIHMSGFNAGGIIHIRLSEHLALEPNPTVGRQWFHSGGTRVKIWYLELPIDLLYTNNGFFAGGGPDLFNAIDGRARTPAILDEIDVYSSEGEQIDFELKRFQIGAHAVLGYAFPNGIQISANYLHGLNNINNNQFSYREVTHLKIFSFSVGYRFGKRM